jgi:hypothetical protein
MAAFFMALQRVIRATSKIAAQNGSLLRVLRVEKCHVHPKSAEILLLFSPSAQFPRVYPVWMMDISLGWQLSFGCRSGSGIW